MISNDIADTLPGSTLLGAGGEKLGKIDTVYTADDTGQPAFVTVHTGLFGAKTTFVPLTEASATGSDVQVPYSKDQVKGAPSVDADQHLSEQEEQELFRYYQGLGGGFAESYDATYGGAGHDTSGPSTDDAMTRSEERLQVGTQQVEAGRARLRKFITTETQTTTVPVSHDEVRVEREPITDGNVGKALDGPELSEEEHEVVLTEERPVVAKETVPVERVRLATETVTEQAQVSEEVRKENIEADGVYPDESTSGRSRTDSTL